MIVMFYDLWFGGSDICVYFGFFLFVLVFLGFGCVLWYLAILVF